MAVVEESKSLNKALYKLELYMIRVIPIVISVIYFINTVLTYYGYRIELFSALCGISLLPLIFIYLSSRVFKFCLRHRLFIYYIAFSEAEAWIDYKIGIPVSSETIFIFDILVFAALVTYYKRRGQNHDV